VTVVAHLGTALGLEGAALGRELAVVQPLAARSVGTAQLRDDSKSSRWRGERSQSAGGADLAEQSSAWHGPINIPRTGEQSESACCVGSLRSVANFLRRRSRKASRLARPALSPGVHHVTSGTLRSIGSRPSSESQSVSCPGVGSAASAGHLPYHT
jgi:hypothetical protein